MSGENGFRDLAEEFLRNVEEAALATQEDLLETARLHSSGRRTLADLRRMDYPYARRHGAPQLPADEINIQGGAFLAGWTPLGPERDGGDLVTGVYNAAEDAPFLLGTVTMFERPVDEKIADEVWPRHQDRVAAALDQTLSG